MSFAAATAVTRTDDRTWSGAIAEGWDIAGNANGGYLLALAARALRAASDRDDPVSITAHYLRPGRPGPVTVEVEVVKQGKAFTTARGQLVDVDGRPLLALLGTFGALGESRDAAGADGPELVTAAAPEIPSIEECQRLAPTSGFPPPFMGQVLLAIHPDDAGFAGGLKSGEARMRGWFSLPDDEPVDSLALLMAVDAFPPTIFNTDLPVAWTPTVELTAHVRERPAPGPLRCAFSTRFVTGGFLEADGEIWDATGRLVAQSRQLALVPRG